MHKKLKKIRITMRYSVSEFAELLGLPKPTYSSYESGHRPLPPEVLKNAQQAQKRDVKFFKELPRSVDKALGGKAVPNEARKNEW